MHLLFILVVFTTLAAVVFADLNLRLDDEDYRHEWEHIFNTLLGYWNE